MIDKLIAIYDNFIKVFPPQIQWIISLIVFVALVIAVIDLVKKNFVWLILLVVLIPAAIPIIISIFNGLLAFLQYIL